MATAAPALAGPPGVTTQRPSAATEAVSPGDTRAGRLAAKPVPWSESPGGSVGAEAEVVPMGPGGAVAGGPPNPKAREAARSEFKGEWEELAVEPEVDFGTANVYTYYGRPYYPGTRPTAYPWSAIGKLYSNRGSCSASVISSRNVIVTAAHCCYTRGVGWNTSFRFVPAEYDGIAPYGVFPWTRATVPTAWITGGARKDDVCVINLGSNAAGRPVTFYTGWLGRSWDWGTILNLHAIGYPGNLDSARTQQLCSAETFSPSSACGGSTVLNMGCNMTFGSSGGPWIWQYRTNNFVNAVVSGYDGTTCTGTFGETFNGPRFTSANIVPLCTSAGC
jgi:V8-like Glu-specific endopeptidase